MRGRDGSCGSFVVSFEPPRKARGKDRVILFLILLNRVLSFFI